MALANTAITNGSFLQYSPPAPGFGGQPTDSFLAVFVGTVTLNSGTAVVVTDAGVTANSVFLFGLKTAGGTVSAPFVSAVTVGTSFSVNGGGSDTSTYNVWRIG